ncbi:hypothetical protein [Thiomonas sp. FB-6]|uniref:DUF6998 domain-containing protein n=1 Tax=Thiomonas sp. FB-6 TaxID=1158291 RepID=UPI0018CA5492|nr:hypothetical protein [Thiomonas sp. FB-6]
MNSPLLTPAPDEVPALIRDLYAIVAKLESIFPGRHFTPDGHLVGSIGEALASTYYGVELCRASTEGYDGLRQGRKVEVKATQGDRVALSSCPEHLLVFRLNVDGSFEECFNGPGTLAWALVAQRKATKNGQHQVSLAALKRVMLAEVPAEQMLELIKELPPGTRRVAHSSQTGGR